MIPRGLRAVRVGVDVDGVLADFIPAYTEACARQRPDLTEALKTTPPSTWGFAEAIGMTAQDLATVWDGIDRNPVFWEGLGPYATTSEDIEALSLLQGAGHVDVYFLTHRVGPSAKLQTAAWLWAQGMESPSVILASGPKGPLVGALRLDLMIEDRAENVEEIWSSSPETTTYLLTRPWNEALTTVHDAYRVTTVREMLEREGLWGGPHAPRATRAPGPPRAAQPVPSDSLYTQILRRPA